MIDTENIDGFQILDTLVNGPSSVAGIYADLVYLLGHERQHLVEKLRSTLDSLERRGWVLARLADGRDDKPAPAEARDRCWDKYASWLPGAMRDDLAIDEIGLWYGITESGRAAWCTSCAVAEPERWELDDDAIQRIVSVVAQTEEVAEGRLADWLSRRRGVTRSG